MEIGEPARSTLVRMIRNLESQVDQVRWTQTEQLHLTLKFLGEVDNLALPEIIDRMKKGAQSVTPFGVEVRGLGSFPKDKDPRVLWAGVKDGVEQLRWLHDAFEGSFTEMGFAPENRQFTPHLTLGRVGRGVDRQQFAERISAASAKMESRFEVDELVLLSSERERGRYVYTPIEYADLG